MEKIWFILINGSREGPYSVKELKKDLRITPETLVWREGFEYWVPIGQVPELKPVFDDEAPEEDLELPLPEDEQIALQMKGEPPALLPIFIIIAVLLFCYMLLKYFW